MASLTLSPLTLPPTDSFSAGSLVNSSVSASSSANNGPSRYAEQNSLDEETAQLSTIFENSMLEKSPTNVNNPLTLDKIRLSRIRYRNLTGQVSSILLCVGGAVYGSYEFKSGNNTAGAVAIVVAVVGAILFVKVRSKCKEIENKSILPRNYKKKCCEKFLFGS